MDLRYEAFCFADPLFFDEQRRSDTEEDEFAAALPLPRAGWHEGNKGTWRMLAPDDVILPGQGWKIHVSACLGNAETVLATVYEYCVQRRIAFKHLRTKTVLLARNSKYAPRDSSGKLITIYPADDEALTQVLAELSDQLAGQPGAYILSDLRYGDGPLYVRYGGFAEQWVEMDGTRVLAVTKPDGTLVPDRRTPTFTVPEWVDLPECLAPHLAARKGGDPAKFPYRVTSSLHFSNGGGVYRATRLADDHEVVLKEARPHAGLDRDGVDAVQRLRREHDILRRLSGIEGVPEAYDLFTVWEHHFLSMEYVPGRSLGSWLPRNYPLTRVDSTEQDIVDYTRRALALVERVATLIDQVHERGVVFGDLHPLNIMVDGEADERVSVIDFEMAFAAEETGRPALGAPGFRAPADRTGFDIDAHALAALRLWVFLPLNALLELSPAKLAGLVDSIERRFPLPDSYGDEIRAALTPRGKDVPAPVAHEFDQPEPDWGVVRKSLATAILASATPHRTDRLFPGDIEQFRVGGTCFGYGAAGVLHALDAAGAGRFPEHERWLIDAVHRDPPTRPGFFDGAHGIAHVLENLGHQDEADRLLADAEGLVAQTRDHSFDGGLSGIGLNLLHFAETRRDGGLLTRAVTIGERLAEALAADQEPGDFARAGLLNGWSGPALLFVRLFEHTGDRGWLVDADRALARDLRECVVTDDGSLQVRDRGARTLPYLGIGSAGVALVAEELAAHSPTAECLGSQDELLRACRGEFVIHPNLVLGRMGLLAALAAANRRDPNPEFAASVSLHLSRLAWYAIPYGEDGIALPGNQLLRLSMDLNTGNAGVLLALAATLDGHGRVLPFLGAGYSLTAPVPSP
ncbi:Lanthionine synthetase C-like protein [Amycolatopsis marina]|uniref:Lanthionine synthetase C-like protein n=1 Tax=Amycolatopsis marina TaxID=490629 RepID=A0A1I0VBH4_9PSEU|nr:class III lanthionine synthetase LanKC [Amycolatopsis marina]SFA73602.1 Lanthionine synthetase C-like protein [Amycolatopsis marina]